MGYQESLIQVQSLSEVAGIDRAIKESEELRTCEYLHCYCAARARRDLYRGDWFGFRKLSDVRDDEKPIFKKGDLFAVVGGARMYQYGFHFLDWLAGISEPGYESLLEDIPLKEAYEEEARCPKASRAAEAFMRRSLNRSYNVRAGDDCKIELPEEFAGECDGEGMMSMDDKLIIDCDIPF